MELQSPRSNEPWLIVMAASAGGIDALTTVLRALPADLPAAIVVVQHRTPSSRSENLRWILQQASALPVVMAEQDDRIRPGTVYLARADLHLTISASRQFSYQDGRPIRFVMASANPLFESAAAVFKTHAAAVVLTGKGSDATDGVQAVKAQGGVVIAEDPQTARHGTMPGAAVHSGAVDLVLPLERIGPTLDRIVRGESVNS